MVAPDAFPAASPDLEPFETAFAMAAAGERLIVAGHVGPPYDTILLARFNQGGALDTSFGQRGFVAPLIPLPEGRWNYKHAEDVAIDEAGRILTVGAVTKSACRPGVNDFGKPEILCSEVARHTLLARFNPDGSPDPSFGTGGFEVLKTAEGELFEGEGNEIVVLPGGKILIEGWTPTSGTFGLSGSPIPFVARLDATGAIDETFGDRGIVEVAIPCAQGGEQMKLGADPCVTGARVRLRVRGMARGKPSIALRVAPSIPWAQVREVRLQLPAALAPSGEFSKRSRVSVTRPGAGPGRASRGPKPRRKGGRAILFEGLGIASALRARFGPGSLAYLGGSTKRKLRFRVTVAFGYRGRFAGRQTVELRARG